MSGMKRAFALIVLLAVLLFSAPLISAGAEEYIVRLSDDLRLYSDTQQRFFVTDKAAAEQYLEYGLAEYIEPNSALELFSDGLSDSAWNLRLVNIAGAWRLGCYGNGVRVGVIDTGAANHSAVAAQLLPGENVITGENAADTTDNYGHGTFISGIIAGAGGSFVSGLASRAYVVPLKFMSKNGNVTGGGDIATAVRALNAAVSHGCKVVNMSFGTPTWSQLFEEAVNNAAARGVIMVAAAGNISSKAPDPSVLQYPAAYGNVIGVSSVDSDRSIAASSFYNNSVFITAPGESVTSIYPNGAAVTGSGTSFSAPHVAALAAVAASIKPDIDTDGFKRLLIASSDDLGTAGYDIYYGNGLINFGSCISELIKDREIFVSPVTEREDGSEVVILNNTAAPLSAVAAARGESDGRMNAFYSQPVSLEVGQTCKFGAGFGAAGIYLWDSLANMQPLAEAVK